MNAYAKFRCAPLRIKKALGIFRELITIRRRTSKVLFGTRLPGSKINGFKTLDKKAVLSQGNRAMPQLFFSV